LSKATLALGIAVFNWTAWATLIGAALAFDGVIVFILFFGIFYVLASLVSCCVGLVIGLLALRAEGHPERRKAYAGVLLILLLGPTLWLGFRVGYGSHEWTEEVRLADGEVTLVHRQNLNGPDEFMQKCMDCVRKATFSGEYRGRRFRWSTDRATMQGAGPLALEFVDGDPVLVFAVTGKDECGLYGRPDPPFRVIRLERRRWLRDRWVESNFAEVPQDAQVNLSGIHAVPKLAALGKSGLLTAAVKDRARESGYTLTPHGAQLSAVGEWLASDPDSCRNRGRPQTDRWLNSKQAVLESEAHAGAVAKAELIGRHDEFIALSADQVRDSHGVTGPIGRTRSCREMGVRVAALGKWVEGQWQNAGGRLDQSDVLISPVGHGDATSFWVLPGPIKDYRQVICLPEEVLVVRSKEANTFLLTRVGKRGTTPVSQRVAVDVPRDLQDQAAYFWTVTDDGREIQMAIFRDEQSPANSRMGPRQFDLLIESRGVQLNLLRYRVL
jgi:hypothetical protein